jgi:AcrR family transcriptional regulator
MAPEGAAAREGGRKSDRTRQAILDAARVAFARKGFSGVTIRDITDLASVTRANFYYYFRDKTEVFIELGTQTYRQALEVVEAIHGLSGRTSRGGIEEWISRYFDYLDHNGAFVVRSADDMPTDRKFRSAVSRSRRRTAGALGEGIAAISKTAPDSDPVAAGVVVIAMLERSWSTVSHSEVSSTSRAAVVGAAAELIWRIVN